MDRNSDDFPGGSESGSSRPGSSGGSYGHGADVSGTGGFAASGSSESGGLGDRAKHFADTARDRLADVGATVREQAGSAKNRLADALDASADRLRSSVAGEAGATAAGDVALSGDHRLRDASGKIAGGIHSTANWLRSTDLDNLRVGVERQVREHPARTLLIAVGIGYLLGKAIRR
jgi:ElaB/YqjD/DUF883 family membrane-anchored ribosome-binding protein